MSKGTPLEGDHSAFDDTNFPTVHSKAVKDGVPQIHVPWPASAGQVPISDGDKYVLTTLSEGLIMTIGTMEGELNLAASPFRIYNLYANNRTITRVFVSVNTAPTGDDVIVDILKNGASIFASQDDMPTILATEYTGDTTTFDDDAWDIGDYLQFEVLQIGSSVAGENLVVQIISQ